MNTNDCRFRMLNAQFNELIQIRDDARQDFATDDSLFRFLDGIENDLRSQLSELTDAPCGQSAG